MNFTIGDTPEQLNTKLAHIDSALPVDGLVYTQETVRQLKAERDALAAQNEKIIAEFKDAMETLQTIAGCTWDSGAEEIADVALDEAKRWVSRWDDSVLKKAPAQHLAEIRAEAGRAGYLAALCDYHQIFEVDCNLTMKEAAYQYAAKIRKGEL